MDCFVVSNSTIDAIVMAISKGCRTNPLQMSLRDSLPAWMENNPEYGEIWPELREMGTLQELGHRLLIHNIEAYEYRYSNKLDAPKNPPKYDYNHISLARKEYKDLEKLMALECYMYQVVDHEEEISHPIFKLLKEVSANLYREYVRALPEWDEHDDMWS
ncbi:MAG: hypothetical protein AB8G05_25375 [Oligoflexales bacterium]